MLIVLILSLFSSGAHISGIVCTVLVFPKAGIHVCKHGKSISIIYTGEKDEIIPHKIVGILIHFS